MEHMPPPPIFTAGRMDDVLLGSLEPSHFPVQDEDAIRDSDNIPLCVPVPPDAESGVGSISSHSGESSAELAALPRQLSAAGAAVLAATILHRVHATRSQAKKMFFIHDGRTHNALGAACAAASVSVLVAFNVQGASAVSKPMLLWCGTGTVARRMFFLAQFWAKNGGWGVVLSKSADSAAETPLEVFPSIFPEWVLAEDPGAGVASAASSAAMSGTDDADFNRIIDKIVVKV